MKRSLDSTGEIYGVIDPITDGFQKFVGNNNITLNVPIHNARRKSLSLDENGFSLFPCSFQFSNYNVHDDIIRSYYPEVAEFVKSATNAYKVIPFAHVVRRTNVDMKYSVQNGQKIGGPATIVHGDNALNGIPARLKTFQGPPCANDTFANVYGLNPLIPSELYENELKGRRIAVINTWRNTSDFPCVDMPLTFCDTLTSSVNDYVTCEFRFVDQTFDTYLGGYSPEQRWYYYPELLKTEAILLKTYDSQGVMFQSIPGGYELYHSEEAPISSTSTLHSAVKDPRVTDDMPRRESIEVRSLVFF